MRRALARWLRRAQALRLISVGNTYAAADAIIGAMEARFMHAHLLKQPHSAAQNRSYVKRLLGVVRHGADPQETNPCACATNVGAPSEGAAPE